MSGRWQNEGAQTSDDAVRDAEGRSLRPSVKCSMGVRWLTVSWVVEEKNQLESTDDILNHHDRHGVSVEELGAV